MLNRWIASGAKYEKHWAYVPPVKQATPPGKNAIDILVRQRLRTLGIKPSAPADRRTLARRLYFDLIGLPPRPEEAEAFVRDKSSDAVSRLIDKLLGNPQFGERIAIGWLAQSNSRPAQPNDSGRHAVPRYHPETRPDGGGLTEEMLSKWKNRGYLEWLEDCRITDAMRARYEFTHNLVTEAGDPRQASRAVLHTLAANLCHMLPQIDPACVRESVLSDADKFSRFVHAVVRLAEGSIKCEEHKTKEEDREAQKIKAARRREKPAISDEALATAEERLQLL